MQGLKPALLVAGATTDQITHDYRKKAAARRHFIRRAIRRARSFADLGGLGHLRTRPRKIRSSAHRHLKGRPVACRNRGAQNASSASGRSVAHRRERNAVRGSECGRARSREQFACRRAACGRRLSRAARHVWRGRRGSGPARSRRTSLCRLRRLGFRRRHGQGCTEAIVPPS